MSNKDPLNRKRKFSLCEPSTKDHYKQDITASRTRKKSFCNDHYTFKPIPQKLTPPEQGKKLVNLKTPRGLWNPRKPKKHFSKKDQPHTPHNTTQFILDAINEPMEMCPNGVEEDRIEFDFHHHAMAGTMMELMERKLFLDEKEKQRSDGKESPSEIQLEANEEVPNDEDDYGPLRVRPVKSANDIEDDAFLRGLRSIHGFEQFLEGTNNTNQPLKDVVKELVAVLKKKDDQIDLLKSITQKSK